MKLERLAARAGATGCLVAVAACGGTTVRQHPIGNRIVPVDTTQSDQAAVAAATPAPAPAAPTPTVFRPASLGGTHAYMQVRKGEHDAAPYIDRIGGPGASGKIVASSEIPGVEVIEARSPYVLDEVLYVKMPAGVTPTIGMHLAVDSLGPQLESGGQVLIPTGELTVLSPGAPGEATTVRLERQYGEVEPDQLVLPMETPQYPERGQRPVAIDNGVKAKVLYVSSNPVQPTIGYYVVLSATERDGVRLGDQFTLLRTRMRDEVTGLWLPEQEIATAQVVRVGPSSTSAMIIAQTMPAIAIGDDARLTAKMP
jgi:hypothetical protein